MTRALSFLVSLLLAVLPAAAEQKLVYNLSLEPKTLDPHGATGVKEAHVILNLIEGLTRTDEKGQAIPAMAERWEVSPDQRTYTFHLRQAAWSNGEPVTADDFVFAWRRMLDPATAAEYAHQLFFLEGAEEFNAGRSKDPSTIGVKALSTGTLEVRLRNPAPFFPNVTAHYAYSPLKESWVRAHPSWPSSPSEYLVNGPFRLAEWRHNDRIVLKKNPRYYRASEVTLETVEMPMVKNASTALQLWESGRIDLIEGDIPLPDIPRLKREGKFRTSPYLGTYFVSFNTQRKPFDDPRVRKAFALVLNREQITRAILRGGQPPAYGMVPLGIETPKGDFRKAGGDLFKEDVAQARRLLAEAGYPNGRGFPRVKYLYNDLEMHRTLAEAFQAMWRQHLGVQVDLQVKEWKVFLQDRHEHNYQLARHGWIGDYPDPLTFLDIFTSRSGNNDPAYSNPEFDRLVEEAQATTDTARRLELFHAAERKLILEDMAVAPVYFYVNQILLKDRVKGLVHNPLGYMYFDKVRVTR